MIYWLTGQPSHGKTILAKLLAYVRLLARSDAGPTTDDATELTALNSDSGAGAGTYAAADSIQATQDDVTTIEAGVDVTKVNGITVTGSGTDSDPWNP